MIQIKAFAFAAAFTMAAICPAIAADDDLYYGGFDGHWEGALSHISMPQYDNLNVVKYVDVDFIFSINGEKVSVYTKSPNGVNEIKKDQFRIAALKTNAIIFTTTASQDVNDSTGSGGWVETWNFTVTHKDKDGLYVVFTRSVNNYLRKYDFKTPDGTDVGRRFWVYSGEMDRQPPESNSEAGRK